MSPNSIFRRINVRADGRSGEIDLGFLAECLLYYDCVNVLGNEGDLRRLIEQATIDGMQRLFKANALRFLLHPMVSGVFTADRTTALERHDFVFVSKINQQTKKPLPFEDLVRDCVNDKSLARSWISRSNSFIQRSGQLTLDLPRARKQLWNGPLLESLLKRWLMTILPNEDGLHQDVSVRAWELAKLLQVASTVDFSEVNFALQRTYGTGNRFEDMNIAHFLGFALDAYADIHYAARTNADIAITTFGSPILGELASHNLRAVESRLDNIHTFQEHVLSNARAVSEAINSSERTFAEIVPIVEKSRLFKHWLSQVDPDVSLVSSYIDAVTKETWAEKLPVKAIRWVTTGVASKVAETFVGSGLLVEALDAFVLDRLLKGWRPNQFIDNNLKKFVARPADN